MKSFLKLTAWLTSAVIALSSISTGAFALPTVPTQIEHDGNVQAVRDHRRPRHMNRHMRGPRHFHRPYYRGRHGNEWRGHRGYRGPRHGYRRHSNGWWYPLAAFGAGAALGGALNQPSHRLNSNHVRWCTQRYQTYRASDNSYVPRAGVRARCVSPYS